MYGIQNLKPLEITFDWLFNRINQEDVFLRYFGFCSLNKKYCNPLRKDRKEDCSFYWYQGTLFFKDFALNKAYSCVSAVMEINKLNYHEALNQIYEEFIGLKGNSFVITKIKRPIQSKEYKDIQVKIQPFTKIDIEYLKQYGITKKLCKMYQVFSIKHYWINGDIKYTYSNFNPCIGYYFDGKWKLYFYNSKEFRFMTNVPHSELQGWNQLNWTGDLCVITKSMKDVIVYRKFNINAVAPHSEGLANWKDKIPTLQKRFERLILNFDNDKPGIKATNDVLKEFDLEVFYFPHKDLSDTYKIIGEQNTKKLIETMKNGRI